MNTFYPSACEVFNTGLIYRARGKKRPKILTPPEVWYLVYSGLRIWDPYAKVFRAAISMSQLDLAARGPLLKLQLILWGLLSKSNFADAHL